MNDISQKPTSSGGGLRLLAFGLVLVASACADDAGRTQQRGSGEDVSLAHKQDELRALARDYLFKEVDERGSEEIRARIRALRGDDAMLLHEALVELAEYDEDQRAVSDVLFARTAARGVPFFDATPEEAAEAAAWVMNTSDREAGGDKAVCVWPWVSCTYAAFPDPVLTPVSCATDQCTTGSLYQRVGNEVDGCEELGCDFQIRFTRQNATRIQGITTAATCVVMKNNKAARRSGPYTWALIGYGSTLDCNLPTGSIHTLFRVR